MLKINTLFMRYTSFVDNNLLWITGVITSCDNAGRESRVCSGNEG